jgi:hypothetical protein
LDPTRTRADVKDASSTFLRSFAIHQQDQHFLNPETHDLKRIQDFVIGHIIGGKKTVIIEQKWNREFMFVDVDVFMCRIPSHTTKLLQSVVDR